MNHQAKQLVLTYLKTQCPDLIDEEYLNTPEGEEELFEVVVTVSKSYYREAKKEELDLAETNLIEAMLKIYMYRSDELTILEFVDEVMALNANSLISTTLTTLLRGLFLDYPSLSKTKLIDLDTDSQGKLGLKLLELKENLTTLNRIIKEIAPKPKDSKTKLIDWATMLK